MILKQFPDRDLVEDSNLCKLFLKTKIVCLWAAAIV